MIKTTLSILKEWINWTVEEKKKNADDLEKEQDEEKKTEINKRRNPIDIFNKLPKFFSEFVHFRSFFFSYLHIYGAAFASMTGSPNQVTVSAISNKII